MELNTLAISHNNLSVKALEWMAKFVTLNSRYKGKSFSLWIGEDDNLIDMKGLYDFYNILCNCEFGSRGCSICELRCQWFYLIGMWMTFFYYFVVDNLIPKKFRH